MEERNTSGSVPVSDMVALGYPSPLEGLEETTERGISGAQIPSGLQQQGWPTPEDCWGPAEPLSW